MASKIIQTSDGQKIQDIKTGKLLGSIGEGKDGIPTTKSSSVNSEGLSEATLDHIALASEKYQEHVSRIAQFTTDAQKANTKTPQEELTFLLMQANTPDLDDVQLGDIYRLLYNGLKTKAADLLPPTDEEWNKWLADTEAKINNITADYSDEERAHFASLLEKARFNGKPDALSYALMTKIGNKIIAARLSLDEGYKQISAWYDVSPVEVKWQVAKFRKEYLDALAQGIELPIREGYARGYKGTSGSGPKDPATIYGHMMAETPELYDPSAIPTRFVAFDTETTGLKPQESNIIQVGLVEYDHDGNELRRFVSYICPPLNQDGEISTGGADAVATHGILPEHVADQPSFKDLVPTLKEYFDGATVIGQNVISFDAKQLAAEYVRAADGDKTAGYNVWPRAADTLWFVQRHLDIKELGLPNYKLSTLNDYFGLGAFDAHDAGADAHVSAKIFFHIRKQMKVRQLEAFAQRRESDEWTIS